MTDKLNIVRYAQSFGRMGGLEDTFVVSDLELRVLKAVGESHRGEVLGKHSDITSRLSDETLTVLTSDAEFIAQAISYKLVTRGDPFSCDIIDRINEDGAEYVLRDMSQEDIHALADAWGFDLP